MKYSWINNRLNEKSYFGAYPSSGFCERLRLLEINQFGKIQERYNYREIKEVLFR
jgi:hypothetical protein